ncbi:MAG: hypothetical protein WCM93_02905 [Bacteroidota bacterium]
MKQILLFVLLILSGFCLKGQTLSEAKEGAISFVTSQNVYVKFTSTENISVGDTLFMLEEAKMIPVLIVKDLSSISCVCLPISTKPLSVADKLITRQKIIQTGKTNETVTEPKIEPLFVQGKPFSEDTGLPKELKQDINGRISISSYSNLSKGTTPSQRMRYTFSLNAQNIKNSKLSAETYISFVNKINDANDAKAIKSDVFNALKIYSLAFDYAFNKNNILSVGRKINPKLSSVGSIDGLQYESKFKSLTVGIFGGTRPDYMNYSFNANLLQYGGYFGHDYATKDGRNMQTSIALVEQKNRGNTDRRFAYFQHSNSLVNNLYLFGSVEFDLFNKKLSTIQEDSNTFTRIYTFTQDNSPNLSNLYLSVRYKVLKQLSLSLSYNSRKNIIYYETYRDIIGRLLEAATMQGYMCQVSYRPGKIVSIGANGGYRYSKKDPRPLKNLYSYLTFNKVPWINASATLSATLMETSYLSGRIYSMGISRDLIPGKIDGGINYRYIKYTYMNKAVSDMAAKTPPLVQHMAEMSLNWRLMKKLSCSMNYEGTFEKAKNYNSIYVNLTQRF